MSEGYTTPANVLAAPATPQGPYFRFGVVNVTASRNLALTDLNCDLRVDSAEAVTLTIQDSSTTPFPTGTRIRIRQTGAGQVTIAAAEGVTLEYRAALSPTTIDQFSTVELFFPGANAAELTGDLATA